MVNLSPISKSLETPPNNLLETNLLINIDQVTLHLNHQEFQQLCENNPDLRLELTSEGELVVMAPAGYESSERNLDLGYQIFSWNRRSGLGRAFDSSAGFTLPSGAIRSPDITWIEKSKLVNIPENVAFPSVVPDFVIELRSKTDSLKKLQEKMAEYRLNGVRLGWLINPQQKQVEIYRLDREVEIQRSPTTLRGEDVLVGFDLDLSSIF
jgi:Uma2 family endonuclease